jgi:hypothetical protein
MENITEAHVAKAINLAELVVILDSIVRMYPQGQS